MRGVLDGLIKWQKRQRSLIQQAADASLMYISSMLCESEEKEH
jgi:hypothetical protein